MYLHGNTTRDPLVKLTSSSKSSSKPLQLPLHCSDRSTDGKKGSVHIPHGIIVILWGLNRNPLIGCIHIHTTYIWLYTCTYQWFIDRSIYHVLHAVYIHIWIHVFRHMIILYSHICTCTYSQYTYIYLWPCIAVCSACRTFRQSVVKQCSNGHCPISPKRQY